MDADKIQLFDALSDKRKAEVLKRLELENMKEETENRMKTDPEMLNFFEDYSPHSIESFINSYLVFKEQWIVLGDQVGEHSLNHALRFQTEAKEGFEMILKKKLLIKMCEWSAGLIELEGIETSDDFYYWEHNIFNCPFLEPVTKEEVDICAAYFKDDNYDDHDRYDTIMFPYTYILTKRARDRNDDDDDCQEPEFSMFYDNRKGTSGKWLLPNIKEEKEQVYKKAYNAERMRKWEQDVADGKIIVTPYVAKPSLDYWNTQDTERFVKKFESPQLLQKFRKYSKFSSEGSHYDDDGRYREPLSKSDAKEQTLTALMNVYDDYLFRRENGLSFEIDEEQLRNAELSSTENKKQIIEGRILLGEPGNLDIY